MRLIASLAPCTASACGHTNARSSLYAPRDSPAENLLMTAHNADYTDDYFELGWQVWASNFERFIAGETLHTPVDMSSGY